MTRVKVIKRAERHILKLFFLIRMLLSRSFTFEGRFVCNGPLSYVEFTNKTPEVALYDKIQ